MTYTQDEKLQMQELVKSLIQQRSVFVDELDAFGDPVPYFAPQAKDQIIRVMCRMSGFLKRDALDNALVATSELILPHIMDRVSGEVFTLLDANALMAGVEREFRKCAWLEFEDELLISKKEIQTLLRETDTFAKLIYDYEREGGEISRDREADHRETDKQHIGNRA